MVNLPRVKISRNTEEKSGNEGERNKIDCRDSVRVRKVREVRGEKRKRNTDISRRERGQCCWLVKVAKRNENQNMAGR